MNTQPPGRSRLALLLWAGLAAILLACVAGVFLVRQSSRLPGTAVHSLKPVASLTCQKYAVPSGEPGSFCAWYMGAATVLVIQAPPEQVIASYEHANFAFKAGPIQFAIGAETTEDENPQQPPLFPVYFGFSLFLEGLP